MDDVKIQGGHGTFLPDGSRFDPYDPYHAGDKDPRKRWDAQYHSIWVTDGGGGTFTNVWSVNTYAQSGFYVSETTTPGRILQLSAEHHGRVEIGLNRVENWELHAPQTEQEVGESPDALSLDIRNSRNILVTNYHGYRVTRTFKPAPMAVRLEHASGIRFRNVHVNAESGLGTCDSIGCTHLPARQQVPVRERDRGRDARPAGARARVRRARRASRIRSRCRRRRLRRTPRSTSSPTASGRFPAAPSDRTARSGSSSAGSIASTAGAPREASRWSATPASTRSASSPTRPAT